MPHVVGLVLLGAGLYAGYRAFVRVAGKMQAELERAEAEAHQPVVLEKDLGSLEYDPASGVYRPRHRG
ncbi:MAG: hypothetical protein ABWZ74_04795 [Hyphomicrobiaceae bacterium]